MKSSKFNTIQFREAFNKIDAPRELKAHLVQDGKDCYTYEFSLSKNQLAELLYQHFRHEAYASLQREECDIEAIKAETVVEAKRFFEKTYHSMMKRFEFDEDEISDLQDCLFGEKENEKDLTVDDLNRFYDEVKEREYQWWYEFEPTRYWVLDEDGDKAYEEEDCENPEDFWVFLNRDQLYQWMIKTFDLISLADSPDAKVHYAPAIITRMKEHIYRTFCEALELPDMKLLLANLKKSKYSVVIDIDTYLSNVHKSLMADATKSRWQAFLDNLTKKWQALRDKLLDKYGCWIVSFIGLAALGCAIYGILQLVLFGYSVLELLFETLVSH